MENENTAKIISGKEVSAKIRGDLSRRCDAFREKTGRVPGLAVIRVGEDPASQVYVRNKLRACEEVGFYSEAHVLPENSTMEELLAEIEKLNRDPAIDGLLVQLPIPRHLDEKAAIAAVADEKDVDAFHKLDAGHLTLGDGNILPCTPSGIMEMLRYYGIPVAGRECVVVGRSNIVGRPMAALLLAADGTVTIAHSRTPDLPEVTRRADILVSAVGKAGLITADMVKPGAVVIDVGMNRNADGKLCGDADFEGVSKVASYITPVPGGVGPMTVTMLLANTMAAAEKKM
ncbi:MAG: bifunctional methylenetetrahydrofolate dehydrogenase/methenyltetrahydrofolate cyclohydrolase FolD [Clostridia bacterium]|nr:bifunctional methylenetetrahydrofolate dehydrogenase/methenyltetrahydrofolate cyclohydrolase FolD [Clostridia bacterium]